MKKLMVALMIFTMFISLYGCGKNGKEISNDTQDVQSVDATVVETTEVKEPLNLIGLWKQDGKSDTETHMVATIRDDGRIGVFFILEDDPEPWTYWVGTYDAPKEAVDVYSWTSENTYGGNGLLSSDAETKEFNYSSEKLSFEVTIQGETSTVELVKGDWDTSLIPDSAFGSVNSSTSEVKDLEIIDSGWCEDNGYLKYYVKLHNPNEEIAVEYPSFRITARDEDNIVIDTEEQTLSIIYPGQDFCFGSLAFSIDMTPASVDFEVLKVYDYNLTNVSILDDYKQLEVINTAERDGKFVGEISNLNNYDIDSATIVVVCKNEEGEVVYVDNTYVDDLKAESTVPFSISYYGNFNIAKVEYYANQW
ncbi:MAG: hypothetical protein IJ167_09885 [Lachnospiraceae bacterium]|nr:hypothetical protein [Lachnospiraceae bacterium]